jgi:uncharacterized protein (TIGR03435 family)
MNAIVSPSPVRRDTGQTFGVALISGFILGLCVAPVHAQAQPDQTPLTFEVASIKANTSGDSRSGTRSLPGGRVSITNLRLRDVIRMAYGSNDIGVIGGPAWIDADRWDILAAAPPGHPDAPWDRMLKSLLVERFRLQAHVERREQPIYELVFARGDKQLGPDLHETSCHDVDCHRVSVNGSGIKLGTMTGSAQTMAELGVSLSRYAERRVFDRTGLEGLYDFRIQWSEDISIFTALQEQVGLNWKRQRPWPISS